MKRSPFTELPSDERDWVDAYLDGTITPEAFEDLQERMVESDSLRQVMRRYLALDHSLETLEGEASESAWSNSQDTSSTKVLPFSKWIPAAAAAVVAFFLGALVIALKPGDSVEVASKVKTDEPSAQGFAVINSLFDAAWDDDAHARREGDTLGSEVFRLKSGVADIQFFSGANMTIEGPAEIVLLSAWEAECRDGMVRMQVPPAARGFKLQAPSTEIIDLGTEFGLSVRDGEGHVEVFDGEIVIRHQDEDEKHLKKGAAAMLPGDGLSVATTSGEVEFPSTHRFKSKAEERRRSSLDRWLAARDELSKDERLIAYYPFDQDGGESMSPNIRQPRNPDLDGAIVLAEPVAGRWPRHQSALEFRRPGSRVRVNIPGEWPAFTFAAWVRIDSLNRRYNALFMGDGYENGEPHWQIRDDGLMMLSVMVDDSKPSVHSKDSAGLHKVYFSKPMWDPSMSGEWVHLASVYDPASRRVAHFVNGKLNEQAVIEDEFFTDKLRIGNAEIGNWGDPFRKDPSFAIRNINGRIDEMAIFGAALSDTDIARLYRDSSHMAR